MSNQRTNQYDIETRIYKHNRLLYSFIPSGGSITTKVPVSASLANTFDTKDIWLVNLPMELTSSTNAPVCGHRVMSPGDLMGSATGVLLQEKDRPSSMLQMTSFIPDSKEYSFSLTCSLLGLCMSMPQI